MLPLAAPDRFRLPECGRRLVRHQPVGHHGAAVPLFVPTYRRGRPDASAREGLKGGPANLSGRTGHQHRASVQRSLPHVRL